MERAEVAEELRLEPYPPCAEDDCDLCEPCACGHVGHDHLRGQGYGRTDCVRCGCAEFWPVVV
jgi:hypothetical protein